MFIPLLLVIRILNEEKVLQNNLNGYQEYMKKIKYRLIPLIW
jgi:protein-S-isoprenylcysteine O-methyltransferase Ste14